MHPVSIRWGEECNFTTTKHQRERKETNNLWSIFEKIASFLQRYFLIVPTVSALGGVTKFMVFKRLENIGVNLLMAFKLACTIGFIPWCFCLKCWIYIFYKKWASTQFAEVWISEGIRWVLCQLERGRNLWERRVIRYWEETKQYSREDFLANKM